MTALETDPFTGRGSAPVPARLAFPIVDEVSRHCLSDDEPETVHIEVHLPGRPDARRLWEAFGRALLVHSRILVRQAPHRWYRRCYEWELTGTPDVDPVSFAGPGPGALARARARALALCPPLYRSPPVRLEVVALDAVRSVLLLTLHHTALDAPSGLRVLATTAALYGGEGTVTAPVAPVRRAPAGRHRDGRVRRARPARLAPDTAARPTRARAAANGMLQMDLPLPQPDPAADWTVNDQLLVAASLMVGRWNQSHGRPDRPVRITMPVDDRSRDLAMPLGNGTRLAEVPMTPADRTDTPLLLARHPDPAAVTRLLRTTARRTRTLKSPQRTPLGPGAALLTAPLLPVGVRGALTRGARRAVAPWTSTLLLSNLGRVPYPLDFGDAGRARAVWFSAPARMPRGLSLAAASTGGRLHMTLRWSRDLLDDAAGAALARLFEECLLMTYGPRSAP
ncbi:condensation protein [Streptomyces sp. T12]|uniref:condensation protein n=1 Tax=Streptomyces sp. T12 TaxID=477697 RepID=UPI00236656D6|nr:condensation protein [Streptomyces sp. T12]WDF35477.1 condensation protein [Streptomyces sp. T12]